MRDIANMQILTMVCLSKQGQSKETITLVAQQNPETHTHTHTHSLSLSRQIQVNTQILQRTNSSERQR